MKTFEVKLRADKQYIATIVDASNSSSARRIAIADIQGRYGYADRNITVVCVREVK